MSTNLRTAATILTEARETGETISGPRVADESLHLEIDGRTFAVSDEQEGGEVVGYTWAAYADDEALEEGDYSEHYGGTTEEELLAAIERFRTMGA